MIKITTAEKVNKTTFIFQNKSVILKNRNLMFVLRSSVKAWNKIKI